MLGIAFNGVTSSLRRSSRYLTSSPQTLGDLVRNVPSWRLRELGGGPRASQTLPTTTTLVNDLGLDLRSALSLHEEIGGDSRIQQVNQVPTNFTALPLRDIQDLFGHARWQVHAMHAIYWKQ